MKKIHLLSGMLLATFIGLHLFNHACSIWGAEVHIQMMMVLRSVYRSIFIETILLLAVVIQIGSGFRLYHFKKRIARTFFEKLQIHSGLYMAFFLLIHVAAVLTGRFLLKLDTNFYFGAAGINTFPVNLFFIPYYAVAILSFFAHIAAIHAQKMKNSLLKLSPVQQAYGILWLGLVITLCIFYGLTNHWNGLAIPSEYRILTCQ